MSRTSVSPCGLSMVACRSTAWRRLSFGWSLAVCRRKVLFGRHGLVGRRGSSCRPCLRAISVILFARRPSATQGAGRPLALWRLFVFACSVDHDPSLGCGKQEGSVSMVQRPPNTRVQRTRSSPSAPRSPLMRWPLGGSKSLWLEQVPVERRRGRILVGEGARRDQDDRGRWLVSGRHEGKPPSVSARRQAGQGYGSWASGRRASARHAE